jgi:DNA-binding beta-propeller fold protein YncE/thiol-disulfide isomerase/thioredoxin
MPAAAVRAPEIDRPGLTWFNVPQPLSLADLRGKLVILDFWTFCCINCLHILPTLKRLEQAFPEDVAVIGVHSPKFAAEREPENVRLAIARHGIGHPVVHDPEFLLWQEYAVRAWPTLIFVSPDGYVIGQHSGEPDAERLLEVVGQTVKDYRRKGTMRPRPLDLAPEAVPPAQFCFPGKIKLLPEAPEAPGKLWMLADSGHHQIVILDDEGRALMRFGSGEPGFANGLAGRARFRDPQGLAADAEAIYVADTGNHAIRRIDRQTGQVTNLAGNGRRGYVLQSAVPFADAELASPWDMALSGGTLYFANAGTHQLGYIDFARAEVVRLAGSGGENITDGPAGEATLAQPSGLALSPDGGTLYFADSETSAIRAIVSTPEGPLVETLVGKGLFEFGHVNGDYDSARLQHCLGLDWWQEAGPEGGLLVADSYNNALRVVDFADRTLRDFDDGFLCEDDVCLPLAEPAGVAVDVRADGAGRVLVSDTNNHRVLEFLPAERRYRSWAG